MPRQRQILHCHKIYGVCLYESIDQVLHDTGKGNLYREKTETVRKLIISLVAQTVKRLSTMQEIWIRSLGREDSLEKEMANHAIILAQIILWAEEPGVHGVTKSRTRLSDLTFFLSLKLCIKG